jgi:hypothetical protein
VNLGTSRTRTHPFQGATRVNTDVTIRANFANFSFTLVSQTPSSGNYTVFGAPGNGFFTRERIAFYSIGTSLNLETLESSFQSYMTAIGALP